LRLHNARSKSGISLALHEIHDLRRTAASYADVGFRNTAAQSLRAKETAHLLDFFPPSGLDQRLKLSASSFGFRLDAADWPHISVTLVREAQARIDAILRQRSESDLVRIRQDYLDTLAKLVGATRAAETT